MIRCMRQKTKYGSYFQAYRYNTPYVNASLRYLQIEIKFAKFDDLKITF